MWSLCEICKGDYELIQNMESQRYDREVIVIHPDEFNAMDELVLEYINRRMGCHAWGKCVGRIDDDNDYIEPRAAQEQNCEPPLS